MPNTSMFRKVLRNEFFNIIKSNSHFYLSIRLLIDNNLKWEEILKAIGYENFVNSIVNSPILFNIPTEKQFETCLKTVLSNYADNKTSAAFEGFIKTVNYNHFQAEADSAFYPVAFTAKGKVKKGELLQLWLDKSPNPDQLGKIAAFFSEMGLLKK